MTKLPSPFDIPDDAPRDPGAAARQSMKTPVMKRFWTSATMVETADGFALTLDGKVPETVNDVLTMTRMDVAERQKRTKSHLGVHSPGARSEDFRGFLKLLYVGWSRDLPVSIDS